MSESETFEEYLARRSDKITERQRGVFRLGVIAEGDAHQKAGCFDCPLLWTGAAAAATSREHAKNAKHEVWVIDIHG